LYDEVTEDQYKSIVRGRLQKDDFVVDDGVTGYMDNGMDDFGEGDEIAESDVEESGRKKKCACFDSSFTRPGSEPRTAKKKAKDTSKAKGKPKAPPPPVVVPSISNYRPAVSEDQEQDLLASILGGMDDVPIATNKKSRKRKPSPEFDSHSSSPPPHSRFSYRSGKSASSGYEDASSDGPIDDGPAVPDSDDLAFSPKKRVKTAGTFGVTPAIDRMERMDVHSGTDDYDSFDNSFDGVDMDAFMDVDDDFEVQPKTSKHEPVDFKIDHGKVPLKPINGVPNKKDSDNPSWLSVYDSLSVTKDDTLGPLNTSSTSFGNNSNISALEPDGSLRFFWLDYLENEGKLYFIGKLKDKDSGAWVSCCVTVEGLQRNLFVLPREKRLEEETSHETDEVPGMKDVYDDFDRLRKKAGIKSWKAKFVKRKYAFGEVNVPKEASWLKVVYGFDGERSFFFCSRRLKLLISTMV
jgi:DNA polymerase alpha subunit A